MIKKIQGEIMLLNNIKIVELNSENWYDCCELELVETQKDYLEPNSVSIAQSKFEPTLKTFSIQYESKTVGFLMFNTIEEELGGYWIYRIMVDKNYQKRGIGTIAAKIMIDEMSKIPNVKRIVAGYHPENVESHKLWSSLGFIDKGDRFGKEMAVVLEL
jgi:diamine N-acetyltransferase